MVWVWIWLVWISIPIIVLMWKVPWFRYGVFAIAGIVVALVLYRIFTDRSRSGTKSNSSKFADFSAPKEFYDFTMPPPEIKTNNLRKPLNVDWKAARGMFVDRKDE